MLNAERKVITMIKEYSKVKLKTGEVGYVVEVSEKFGTYLIELPECVLRSVRADDIASVIS